MSHQEPREHRLPTSAGDLAWFEWGTPGQGPSVLLLHATGFHARVWDAVVVALPPGTHVIAPDLPGHGRSFRPDSLSDWAAIANAILPLIDQYGAQSLVGAGHSMGGYCLTRLAAERADAFRHILLIDPVILPPCIYDPSAEVVDPDAHPVSKRRNHWVNAEEMFGRFASREPYSKWQPEVLADYCRWGLVPVAEGDTLELGCPPRLEASCYLGSAHNDPYPLVAQVTCPVTLLRAPQPERASPMDFSPSPTWSGLADRFADARDILWDDVTHFIPMEQPARVAQLIAQIGQQG